MIVLCMSPAHTEIYTLSLHDALPISRRPVCSRRTSFSSMPRTCRWCRSRSTARPCRSRCSPTTPTSSCGCGCRSEEHTFELQSHSDLVCRLLLEKKKETDYSTINEIE